MKFMKKFKKIGNYLKSFWKYYILRKPKLLLTIILTIVVYIWINNIFNEVVAGALYGYKYEHRMLSFIRNVIHYDIGVFILFIKPIFIYIAGLIIIKRI